MSPAAVALDEVRRLLLGVPQVGQGVVEEGHPGDLAPRPLRHGEAGQVGLVLGAAGGSVDADGLGVLDGRREYLRQTRTDDLAQEDPDPVHDLDGLIPLLPRGRLVLQTVDRLLYRVERGQPPPAAVAALTVRRRADERVGERVQEVPGTDHHQVVPPAQGWHHLGERRKRRAGLVRVHVRAGRPVDGVPNDELGGLPPPDELLVQAADEVHHVLLADARGLLHQAVVHLVAKDGHPLVDALPALLLVGVELGPLLLVDGVLPGLFLLLPLPLGNGLHLRLPRGLHGLLLLLHDLLLVPDVRLGHPARLARDRPPVPVEDVRGRGLRPREALHQPLDLGVVEGVRPLEEHGRRGDLLLVPVVGHRAPLLLDHVGQPLGRLGVAPPREGVGGEGRGALDPRGRQIGRGLPRPPTGLVESPPDLLESVE
mmetsp:Transcript_12274/g.28905  ORF Transcript_12274/g.28905 Transcript_12274/m.28905 type:complete len:427 (+) Transcript_12274:5113-6393(+)